MNTEPDAHAPPRSGAAILARYLGPLALALVIVAVAAIVRGTVGGSRTSAAAPAPPAVVRPRSHHHFWIVRAGQTVSLIVSKTGVSQAVIERLNPGLDPRVLRTGQLVRVRP